MKQYIFILSIFCCSLSDAKNLFQMPIEDLKSHCEEYKQGCLQAIYLRQKIDKKKMIEFLGKLCYLGNKKSCLEIRKLKKKTYKIQLPLKEAQRGNTDAQYDIAMYYLNNQELSYSEGMKWLNKAALSNPIAQYELAYFYHDNKPLIKDQKKQKELLISSAEGGYSQAQSDLSRYYYTADNINDNYKKAFYWAKKAAEQEYTEAEYLLGLYYSDAIGTEADYEIAVKYLRKAAEKNHYDANQKLATLYLLDKVPNRVGIHFIILARRYQTADNYNDELYLGTSVEKILKNDQRVGK